MVIAAILLVLAAFPAAGQQQTQAHPKQPVDARIASELVEAQAAEIALANKLIAVLREDMAKRERDWAEYSRPLWQDRAATGPN